MKIEETSLKGVYLITPDIHRDYRGEFAETFSKRDFAAYNLETEFVEYDVSMAYYNVLKGMHGDTNTVKLVECVYGSVYDVVLNCDRTSPDFGKWQSFILSDANKCALYIPPMYGNSYYVLSDKCIFTYKKSVYFEDVKEFTYRWNDPFFHIEWPTQAPVISARDREARLVEQPLGI